MIIFQSRKIANDKAILAIIPPFYQIIFVKLAKKAS